MGSLASGFKRIQEKNRNGSLAHWAFDRLSAALSRLGLVVQITLIYREGETEIEAGTEIAQPKPRLAGITWGLANASDLLELTRIRPHGASDTEFVDRVKQGAECYYLRHDGRIVGFTWSEINGAARPRFGLRFGPTDAYLYDAYSLASHRGLNLLPFLRYQVYRDLRRRGCKTILSSTDIFNRAAHRFKQKLGAQPIAIRLYLNLFGHLERVFTIHRFGPPLPSAMKLVLHES